MPYAARLDSKQPLDLPPICACCGTETRRTSTIVAESPGSKDVETLLGCLGVMSPVFHLAAGAATLQKKRVRIPFCRRCRLDYFLPAPRARLPLCGFILLIVAAVYILIAFENLAWGGALIIGAFFLLFIGARRNAGHEARRRPMQVFYQNRRYQYVAISGPYVEYFRDYPSADPESLKQTFLSRYRARGAGAIKF
jgi:hypothetical protein